MSSPERRYTAGTVELREAPTGRVIGGYAAKYNKLSQNLGGFVERINPRAFTQSVNSGGDVLARFNHQDDMLLGRTSAGTLRLQLDAVGLDYAADLPDTGYGRDLGVLAARGDVRHSSFAFRVAGDDGDDWGMTDQDFPVRTLLSVQLVDVAPVVSPAYLDTSSAIRSLADRLERSPEEVDEVAHAGRLAELMRRPATVVDLGRRGKHSAIDEPRDPDGKWTAGAGGAAKKVAAEADKLKLGTRMRLKNGETLVASRKFTGIGDGAVALALVEGNGGPSLRVGLGGGDFEEMIASSGHPDFGKWRGDAHSVMTSDLDAEGIQAFRQGLDDARSASIDFQRDEAAAWAKVEKLDKQLSLMSDDDPLKPDVQQEQKAADAAHTTLISDDGVRASGAIEGQLGGTIRWEVRGSDTGAYTTMAVQNVGMDDDEFDMAAEYAHGYGLRMDTRQLAKLGAGVDDFLTASGVDLSRAEKRDDESRATHTTAPDGPGETHPPIAVRRRRLALLARL